MKAKEYQKIYQNIKEKAPLESGAQTLVYMFLFEIIKDTDYQLIVIDRMRKNTQFVTTTGISDLAIVSDEFRFAEEGKNNIISYVEVKGTDINLDDFEDQIKGQLLSCGRILCTNGSVWKYYDIKKYSPKAIKNKISSCKNDLKGPSDYEKYISGELDQITFEVYKKYEGLNLDGLCMNTDAFVNEDDFCSCGLRVSKEE